MICHKWRVDPCLSHAPLAASARALTAALFLSHTHTQVGSAISPGFIAAIEKGFREAVQSGGLTGHPVDNVRVTLTDGASHAVDSSELAFKIAALNAFRQARPTSGSWEGSRQGGAGHPGVRRCGVLLSSCSLCEFRKGLSNDTRRAFCLSL